MTRERKRNPASVSVDTFRDDPLFPRFETAVAAILATGNKVVTPVDVLVKMGHLNAKDLDDWRFGRVPYLERVIVGNLTKLSRLLRILGMHAHDLKLVPRHTAYVKLGGGRRTPLRFTKTGEAALEEAYARHFIWPGKVAFHAPDQPRERPTEMQLSDVLGALLPKSIERVLVYLLPIDTRSGPDKLRALVGDTLHVDLQRATAYVFANRRCDSLVVYFADESGEQTLQKRLDNAIFALPQLYADGTPWAPIESTALSDLLRA